MNAVPTLCPRQSSRARSAVAATERATRAAYRMRIANRIAKRLAWRHGIPLFESTLVMWLTTAHCTCNIDALTDWVRIRLADRVLSATDDTGELLETIDRRLCRHLASIEDSRTW